MAEQSESQMRHCGIIKAGVAGQKKLYNPVIPAIMHTSQSRSEDNGTCTYYTPSLMKLHITEIEKQKFVTSRFKTKAVFSARIS